MTKMYNDLLLAADSGHVSALCLLDLTAAFDTVDHDTYASSPATVRSTRYRTPVLSIVSV